MTSATSISRKTERTAKLRAEILTGASELFAERGYENVTLRAIGGRIGYTHAMIYRYFPDKSHILAALCRETFALLVGGFDAIASRVTEPKERLFESSRGLVRFFLAHPQHVRVVFFGPENRHGIRAGEYIGEIGGPLFDRFVDLFAVSAEAEGLIVKELALAAHSWWCSVMGLAMVLIIQGSLPGFSTPERLVDETIETMWRGLVHRA